MKNNIKYAGIAAAALLTVAPIATPVVNSATNTQVAQAATDETDPNKANEDQLQVLNTFFSILKNQNVDNGTKFNFFDDLKDGDKGNYNQSINFNTLSGLAAVKASGAIVTDAAKLQDSPITFKVLASDNAPHELTSQHDLDLAVNAVKKDGGSLTLTIQAFDNNGKDLLKSTTLTFTNNNKVTEAVNEIHVSYTSPVKVDLNSSTTPIKYNTSVDATVTDQNGNDIKTSNPVASTNIYTTSTDALNMGAKNKFNGSTFDEKGTYYQAVEVTLDKSVNAQGIYDNMQHQNGLVTFNGTNAIGGNVKGNVLRFVREIQVGDPTPDKGEWEETASAGKVTVGNSIAHLYNDDNDLTSRSVAGNTDWATDKYRTNTKTGQIQYHVSTHEWVNATDVTFTGNGNNGEGLTNVTDLQGIHVVNLAGPEGFVYTLFTLNGGQGNRGLAGLTSWATDKTAQDANGNTYYRVSTDEWVRAGEGVTFN